MVPREINELLTQVGPGTPAGDLLRRYWQPVTLADELPSGGPPVPVRLLGEDLVLFRDSDGQPGLLGLYCAHRGADLSYGRTEDGGLRCIYHGWLYDVHGRCIEQPGEPPSRAFADKIRHTAYPCIERSGAIFAYLGPGDPPLLPGFEFLTCPEENVASYKLVSECNYLQGNEGNIDSVHLSFVHRQMKDVGPGRTSHQWFDEVEPEETEYGIRNYFVRRGLTPDSDYVHITNFLMPNLAAFGGARGNGYSINWHVPIDDTHHWKYTFQYRADQPLDKQAMRAGRTPLTPDYRPLPHKANRYQQDRALMDAEDGFYSGISGGSFQAQDLCVTEGRPIQDRTQEHLGYGDRAIIAARSMLIKAIKDLQEGIDPPGVVRDPAHNRFPLIVRGDTVAAGTNFRTYWQSSQPR
jgi:phenylpropionate dioxygenase-like ring-hydroxylating dioxygenase large terminal subunit